ncbi:MAG: ribose-phosphate pyrophosphokinase [Bacteroidetes bacterium CG23_combo_of_CG06-09_8_20_14_all_32_9]|nr:MAG: ribose-phosphate pyrophosphokinase [Bacteroidetes bacterium CG23_combo_of_CG06-09_8_20_14_all_32_9]
MSKSSIKFFAGRQSRYIAEKIVKHFGSELGKSSVTVFSDGEFQPSFEETVRGCSVFIIQSTFPPLENLMELMLMADAAKRASAYKVIAVIPYFGWARQDRKDKPRVSIGAKLVADLLYTSGIDRVMTMDLHADQIQGFFNMQVDHIYASTLFVPYIKSLNIENLVVASPDMGGTKRANAYSRFLDTEMTICYKLRKQANIVDHITVIGEVKNKNVVIVDDIIDTAGTICLVAKMMMERGAKSVRAVASHPVLSGNAYERINNSQITEVIVTDSIPLKQQSPKIKVISLAALFADVINKVYNYQSISSNFIV